MHHLQVKLLKYVKVMNLYFFKVHRSALLFHSYYKYNSKYKYIILLGSNLYITNKLIFHPHPSNQNHFLKDKILTYIFFFLMKYPLAWKYIRLQV